VGMRLLAFGGEKNLPDPPTRFGALGHLVIFWAAAGDGGARMDARFLV